MINSNKLNILSVNSNRNVRVFPKIYNKGGYRNFASTFPTSYDDIDISTSNLGPNELKVYFELFLNEASDDWSDSDGGQTQLKSLVVDDQDQIVSVAPKRNRLLLAPLLDQLQAVSEVTAEGKLRISLTGCFVCTYRPQNNPVPSSSIPAPVISEANQSIPKEKSSKEKKIDDKKKKHES